MCVSKITVSVDKELLKRLDAFIKQDTFKNRSQAVQVALSKTLDRLEHRRLAEECAKLDRDYEQRLADEGLSD